MLSRIAALLLGAIAGAAVALALALNWSAETAGLDIPGLMAFPADFVSRVAGIAIAAITAFAVIAMLCAVIGGWAEALIARARINALRHDLMLADRWSAADWRAALAHSAASDHAEAIIAAQIPAGDPNGGISEAGGRRILVDSGLLLALEGVWLDRLTLARILAPTPGLALAVGAVWALLRHLSGDDGWEIAFAAGILGWIVITAALFLARLLLGPAVAMAVRAATAALRPLTTARLPDPSAGRGVSGPSLEPFRLEPVQPPDMATGAMPSDEGLSKILTRMADAADRMSAAGASLSDGVAAQLPALASHAGEAGAMAATAALSGIADSIRGAVQQREQAIEAALAEVRAGIERLLESPAPAANDEVAAAIRQAAEELRAASAQLTAALLSQRQPS